MAIEFRCPSCDKLLKTSEDKAGRRAKCPQCSTPVTVPHPAEVASSPAEYEDIEAYRTPDDEWSQGFGAPNPPPVVGGGATKSCPMCGETIKAAATKCRFCGESLAGDFPYEYEAPSHHRVEYAGFWLRFVAAFIDGLVLGAIGAAIGFVFAFAAIAGGGGPPGEAFEGAMQLVGIILGWLYSASMESSSNQATLGKMAVGIIVTDERGRRIGFGRATGRFFAEYLSLFTLLIGYMMAGFTERKQALHDMIAGTLVIRK